MLHVGFLLAVHPIRMGSTAPGQCIVQHLDDELHFQNMSLRVSVTRSSLTRSVLFGCPFPYSLLDFLRRLQLARTLRKFKERKEGKGHKNGVADFARDATAFLDVSDSSEEEDDGSYPPPVDDPFRKIQGVVKRKVFPLPLQTVEEAVLCLEYIDHSFYLVSRMV